MNDLNIANLSDMQLHMLDCAIQREKEERALATKKKEVIETILDTLVDGYEAGVRFDTKDIISLIREIRILGIDGPNIWDVD